MAHIPLELVEVRRTEALKLIEQIAAVRGLDAALAAGRQAYRGADEEGKAALLWVSTALKGLAVMELPQAPPVEKIPDDRAQRGLQWCAVARGVMRRHR